MISVVPSMCRSPYRFRSCFTSGGRLVEADRTGGAERINRSEPKVVLVLDALSEISFHIRVLEPTQGLGIARSLGNWGIAVAAGENYCDRECKSTVTRHTPNENKMSQHWRMEGTGKPCHRPQAAG